MMSTEGSHLINSLFIKGQCGQQDGLDGGELENSGARLYGQSVAAKGLYLLGRWCLFFRNELSLFFLPSLTVEPNLPSGPRRNQCKRQGDNADLLGAGQG